MPEGAVHHKGEGNEGADALNIQGPDLGLGSIQVRQQGSGNGKDGQRANGIRGQDVGQRCQQPEAVDADEGMGAPEHQATLL